MAPEGTLYAIDPYEKGRLGFSIPRVVGRRELESRAERPRRLGPEGRARKRRAAADIRDGGPFDFVFVDDATDLRDAARRVGGLVAARRGPVASSRCTSAGASPSDAPEEQQRASDTPERWS